MTLFMASFMTHFWPSEIVFHDTLRSTTTLLICSWQHVFHDISLRTRVWPAQNTLKRFMTLLMPSFMALFMARFWPSKAICHDTLRSTTTLLSFSWQPVFHDITLRFFTTAFVHDMSFVFFMTRFFMTPCSRFFMTFNCPWHPMCCAILGAGRPYGIDFVLGGITMYRIHTSSQMNQFIL